MALIPCPECGREISDRAATCPNCGVSVPDLLKEQQIEKELAFINSIDYEVDGDNTKCKACSTCGKIFWNPNVEAYQKGFCIECRGKHLYDKLIKIDYSVEDFIASTGKAPEYHNYFSIKKYASASDAWIQRVKETEKILFLKYVQNWESLDKDSWTYKLNIENLFTEGKGAIHDEIHQRALENVKAILASASENLPKCPTCGSTSVKKISASSKGTSVALFGVFSDKFGKTFECRQCGYRW